MLRNYTQQQIFLETLLDITVMMNVVHLLLFLICQAEGLLDACSFVQETPPHIDVTDISYIPSNHIDTHMKHNVCAQLLPNIRNMLTRSRSDEILKN